MSDVILKMEHIDKSFDGKTILKDFNSSRQTESWKECTNL